MLVGVFQPSSAAATASCRHTPSFSNAPAASDLALPSASVMLRARSAVSAPRGGQAVPVPQAPQLGVVQLVHEATEDSSFQERRARRAQYTTSAPLLQAQQVLTAEGYMLPCLYPTLQPITRRRVHISLHSRLKLPTGRVPGLALLCRLTVP